MPARPGLTWILRKKMQLQKIGACHCCSQWYGVLAFLKFLAAPMSTVWVKTPGGKVKDFICLLSFHMSDMIEIFNYNNIKCLKGMD